MNCTRRSFLKGGLATLFFSGMPLPGLANSQKKKNIIVIMLRGGMDGLTAVPVISDPSLNKLRKNIIIEDVLKLNTDFALHPKLQTFHELFENQQAAVVHATSIPYTGRSHFEGQDLMETGSLTPYASKTGWLGRGLNLTNNSLDGLALALPMPLILRGSQNNNNFFPSRKKVPAGKILSEIKSIYEAKGESELAKNLNLIINRPLSMLVNDKNLLTLSRVAAQTLRFENGPNVAVFDIEGFDTHSAQGDIEGKHAEHLYEVDTVVKTLQKNLKDAFDDTLILTVTEFGRTVSENSGRGTEHGYGSAILMAGGLLKKSQVYSDWPGLKQNNLFEGRDLQSTIDARSVYASAMATVFDLDFELVKREVFWNQDVKDLSSQLFRT
jgi:uncharacterized protein (DUF1501 family)